MNLKTLFQQHKDRFTGKWDHYFDVYERHLQHFVGQEFTLLEVGVSNGGSLQLWKKYFGPKVRLIGIDIDPRTMYQEEQIQTFCGSQSDPSFILDVMRKTGTPDVIIDDGSHDQMDIINTFNITWRQLNMNGVYIVEDTHTAYNPEYAGGINSPLNFVSMVGRFVNDVNLTWIKEPYSPVASDLKSISVYDSMVVLEKAKQEKKIPVFSGTQKIPGV